MTTTALSEVLHRMRTHKVNHGKSTSPTLVAFADEIESALASAEPVAYEERMRPIWDERAPWTPWERCSRESYENFVSKPHPWISNDWEIQRRSLYPHAKPAAKVEAERFETSPEDRFEQFVQAEIGRSPKPLQELGEYLTRALDEDEFPTANRLLLQLAVEYSTPASVPEALLAIASHLRGEDLAEGLPDGWEKLADYEEIAITLNVRTIRAVLEATNQEGAAP